MQDRYFVAEDSVVREIWGKADTIMVIFAGAAAEFALNKAVDWLYFTGRLPADPLGRLFSTVAYARQIIFADGEQALKAIDAITAIHRGVEEKRGAAIPDWAYRDVLFMLIDYSVKAFEVLERKLKPEEKQELFDVFYRMGVRMGLQGLPVAYDSWEVMREQHLDENLAHSRYTADLFQKYRQHLGPLRYRIMLETQTLVVPKRVREMLRLRKLSLLYPVLGIYKLSRILRLDIILKAMILPAKYKAQIYGLDVKPAIIKAGAPA